MSLVVAIRITDPYVIKQVVAEQERTGEATATKTAMRLINERLAQLELQNQRRALAQPASA